MEDFFGSCTNHGECEEACPKEIPIDFIAWTNRDYIKAKVKNRKTGRLAVASLLDVGTSKGDRPAWDKGRSHGGG